jgi:hypothetical protein
MYPGRKKETIMAQTTDSNVSTLSVVSTNSIADIAMRA